MSYNRAYPRPGQKGAEQKKGGSTMKAEAFLLQIKKLDRMIENKQNEKERWLMLAMSTSAGAAPDTGVKVQSSGSQSRMADAVDRSIDIGMEIDEYIHKLSTVRQQIIGVIEQLPVDEYDVLHKLYVGEVITDKYGRRHFRYLTLQEAADACEKSYSWARGIKGSALPKVKKIIDAQQIEPVVEQIKRWNSVKV